jgi:hypothetical protein
MGTVRFDRITSVLLWIAGLWSAVLVVLAFVIHTPVRGGSHNLVRSASGGYVEIPALPKTYFQAYGVSELLLLGLGLVLVFAVAYALQRQRVLAQPGAGRVAWGISLAPYMIFVGILLVLACSRISSQPADLVSSTIEVVEHP